MSYTPYTPVPTGSLPSADIDLPDDAELENSGIGAFDAPLEDLADRVARVYANTSRFAISGESYGTIGGTVDSHLNSVVVHTVQSGGGDADIAITGCRADDYLKVTACFAAGVTGCTAQIRVRVTYDDGLGSPVSEVLHGISLQDGEYNPVTLLGVHEVTQGTSGAPVTVTATVEIVNSGAGGGVGTYIFGQFALVVERSRF